MAVATRLPEHVCIVSTLAGSSTPYETTPADMDFELRRRGDLRS